MKTSKLTKAYTTTLFKRCINVLRQHLLLIIVLIHAVVNPLTVMVKILYAPVALTTVMY